MKIGVVGLGAGVLAAFGEEGDEVWFYELNPDVIALSEEWFTYRADTPAAVKVVLGDARLRIEEEPERREEDRFDVLFIDAFTGGSVPLHLLTVECASIYRRQLKSDGILAVNISNRNLELAPVAFGMARHLGWEGVYLYTWGDPEQGSFDVHWVLITANEEFLDSSTFLQAREDWGEGPVDPLTWTDDYASLVHVLKR
jgi:spermidine synthase